MGEAWKKSEALAARRERQKVRERQAEERFTAQKRREFLSLIRNGGFTQRGNEKTRYLFQGLREWRQQNERKIDRSDKGKKEVSLGTQLGRRMADLVFLGDEIHGYNCRGSLRSGVRKETGGTPPAETSQ